MGGERAAAMGEGGGLRKREVGRGRGLLDRGEEGETGPWEGKEI